MKKNLKPKIDNKQNTPKPTTGDGTDGKVTMTKDGKGKRFHVSRIEEMQTEGWVLA